MSVSSLNFGGLPTTMCGFPTAESIPRQRGTPGEFGFVVKELAGSHWIHQIQRPLISAWQPGVRRNGSLEVVMFLAGE
jgi:hypothetical protein